MKKEKICRCVMASFLIILGLLALGKNFNLINFDFSFLKNLWPVVLILIGMRMILKNRKNS